MKKGTSQLDWIMSLALFVLYVGWFFAFITPSVSFRTNQNAMLHLLEQRFIEEFEHTYYEMPLFLFTNSTKVNAPLIIDEIGTNFSFIQDVPHSHWEDYTFISTNISAPVTYFDLTTQNVTHSAHVYDIEVLPSEISTENFSVQFSQGLPNTMRYIFDRKIDDIEYRINGQVPGSATKNITDQNFLAIYEATVGNLEHAAIVFHTSSDVYFRWKSIAIQSNHTITMHLTLDQYQKYYASNLYFGDISYGNASTQRSFSADSLTLYEPNALTMLFPQDVEFNLTSFNNTLEIDITFDMNDEFWYRYLFHDGDYQSYEISYAAVQPGVIDEKKTLDFENLQNYSYYVSAWKLPSSRQFIIRVYDVPAALQYATTPFLTIGSPPQTRQIMIADTVEFDYQGGQASALMQLW